MSRYNDNVDTSSPQVYDTSLGTSYTNTQAVIYAPLVIGTLAQAQDLYRRGWNVIPLPRGIDWQERNIQSKPHEKTPFMLEPLFLRRLHFCGDPFCRHIRSDYERFDRLFFKPFTGEPLNIGVILGKTSGNLFQIDCETVKSLYQMKEELDKRSLPYWGTLSARGGSFFLRCAEGEIQNAGKLESWNNEVELWTRERFAVLPPSRHPDGKTIYAWQTGSEPRGRLPEGEALPAVSIRDLAFLGAELYQGEKPAAVFLSAKNLETLENGVQDGNGRNDRFSSLCYQLAGHVQAGNISEANAMDMAQTAGEKFRPPYSQERIDEVWHYAMKKPRKPGAVFTGLTAIPSTSINWRKLFRLRAGNCRSVYELAIDTAAARGTPFMLSIRFVSEQTNIASLETVELVLGALLKAGLLQRCKQDKQTETLYYTFGIPVHNCNNIFTTENIVTVMNTQKEFQGALNGLAYCAGDIYKTLLKNPTGNVSQLARDIGANVTSTRRGIGQLRAIGLVEQSPAEGLYYAIAVTAGDWQAIAEARGIVKKQADKKARYDGERDAYPNRRMTKAIFSYYGKRYTTRQKNAAVTNPSGGNQRA